MEANSATFYASLIVIFLFAVDLAKNDKIQFIKPAAAATIRSRVGRQGLEGPGHECSIPLNQTVWFLRTGQCETLLAKGPCESGEWLVMSSDRLKPVCKKYECKFPSVHFNGTCVQYKDRSRCPGGMHVSITETGEGVCDCQPAHVYWRPNPSDKEQCYPLFRRGPCDKNEYLVFSKRTQKVKCTRNPCPDGQVKPKRSPECIPLDTTGGPCNDIQEGTVLTVNETTMELNCAQPVRVYNIIEAPLLNCSPGSRRDANGKCRKAIG
ncbi:uncharacterized protein LOC132194488 [Neocloeon triangulifer]|uniref:uncharacterized protein LOC132194488 n=1 Tax=Neocloeon triangulifer TaxID=2078957 RepID=UPI00286FA2A7|nr:uncharacterized protein LOC132194488 [Neocloeon triangulifer]